MNNTFEQIRPFDDNEIKPIINELLNDSMFIELFSKLYPNPEVSKQLLQILNTVNSTEELQRKIVIPLLNKIKEDSIDELTFSAMEQFNPKERYLFISNHRDIILDSAYLNYLMLINGFNTTEIAIGDNLLAFPWIKNVVRINRAFIVKRNLGLREQLAESKRLSEYIRYAITTKKQSAWIAQREGRSKDGFDKTQVALLKMLNMSNGKSLAEGFKEINIVPMAISYEIEPCGISKVEELLNKKHNSDFKKSQQDDLNSMANGILKPKGRIHFAFGNPVNTKIDELTAGKNNNEALQTIAEYIDKRIYFNYKLWTNNYIAADLLNKASKYTDKYTDAEKETFTNRMNKEIATIAFETEEATEQYLKMYATPVFNFEKHFA